MAGSEKDSRSGSSAKIGLVLYQYTAPKARAQRAAVPLHVDFLSAGAVVRYRREEGPRCVAGRMVRNARGADLTAARYMTAACCDGTKETHQGHAKGR